MALSVVGFSEDELRAYCRQNWAALSREPGSPGHNFKQAAKISATIYERARNSIFDFIILGSSLRTDRELTRNVGLISYTRQRRSLERRYETAGAILGVNPWSRFANDLFMLGAVHAGKTVFVASPDGEPLVMDDCWDWEKEKLTTLGRELLLPSLTNYTKVETTFSAVYFGDVFIPSDEEEDRALSLADYRASTDAIDTLPDSLFDLIE